MNVIIFTGSSWIDPDHVNDTDASIYPVLRSIGAYQVASVLRSKGYTVKVIDYFPFLLKNRYNDLISLIEKYVNSETLWVGYSTTFFDGYDATSLHPLRNEKIYSIKNKILSINNKIKTVIGGAKAWKKEFDNFTDFYIEGYADSTVIELTKYISGKNPFFQIKGKSVISDRAASNFNFDNYSFAWDKTDAIHHNECLPIEIARGCIFKCAYCSYPLNGKKKLDFIKKPEVLLSEFNRNYELYGITSYMYTDDTHNDSLDKLKYLYDEVYSKLSFKIKFNAYLRLDLLRAHPEMIPLLRESGLYSCFFGIESLNYASNKTVGKGMQMEKTIDTLHLLRKEWPGVFMQGGFIVGLPNESEISAREWLTLVSAKDFPLDRITMNPLHLYKDQGESGYWFNDIENNPENYGYTLADNAQWTNNTGLTKQQATQIVKDTGKLLANLGKNKVTWLTDWRLQNINLSREVYNQLSKQERIDVVNQYIENYVRRSLDN
jgi:radical SAM superfamily enzyme